MRVGWILTAVLVVAVAAGSFGLYSYLRPQPLPERIVYGNGHIEGTEIHVPAEIPGRIVENRLMEGQPVDAGELLVRLDDTDLQLQRQSAEAEIDALRAQREEITSEIEVWRHHLQMAKRDLDRFQRLRERNTVSQQQAEQAENVFREAEGRVASLGAKVRATDKLIIAARKQLDLIENRIAKTEIMAPVSGTVLAKAREVGEFVQPGQTVAVIVDLSRLELQVFIPEADVGKVNLDDAALIKVDAFPDRRFEARVARISQQAQFTPRDIHMPEERVRMVFGITLAVENPKGILKPGMPADAWILWLKDAEWPERLFVPR